MHIWTLKSNTALHDKQLIALKQQMHACIPCNLSFSLPTVIKQLKT